MRQRNRDGVAQVEPRTHATCETRRGCAVCDPGADRAWETRGAQHAPDCKPAHRDDQPGPEQLELPLEPEAAELELARARRPVATSAWVPPGIAARDGRAVEGRVEPILVHVEPAAKRLASPAAPRAALDALDDSRRLADDHRALARASLEGGQRLEGIARLDAGPADPVVPLERGKRPIAGAFPGDCGSLAASSSSCLRRLGAGACSSASGP